MSHNLTQLQELGNIAKKKMDRLLFRWRLTVHPEPGLP
jgi:hypothetical protein